MAQQKYYTILTEVGKSKIANATVLNEKVQFSKMQLGDGGGSQYEPHEKQTALKNKVWEGSINNVKVDENNPNWIVVETAIPGNAGGWTVREVGIFDDEGELLAIGKYPETYKPVVDDGCVKDLFVRVILMVVNTSSVALKIDPTVILASMKNLDDLRKELNAKVDATKTELNTKIDEVRSDLDSIELTGTKVSIEDEENNFVSTDVEGALKELADSDNSLEIAINNNKSEVNGKIDDLKQSVSSGKQLIATATTGRGVPTNGSDSFQQMADNIGSIKTKLPVNEGQLGVAEDINGNVYSFNKLFNRHIYNNPMDAVKTMEVTRNLEGISEDFIVSNNAIFIFSSYYGKILKISLNCEVLWTYTISGINTLFVDNKENIYASSGTELIKLSSDGELLWKEVGLVIKHVVDNYMYVYGTKGISKLNLNKEEQWYYPLNSNPKFKIRNSHIYLYTNDNFIKLDYNGSLIYELPINNGLIGDVDSEDNIYTYGETGITKKDYKGNILWTYDIPHIIEIKLDSNDFLYTLSHNKDYSWYYVTKINPHGRKQWEYGVGYKNKMRNIFLDEDDYIYAVASNSSSGAGGLAFKLNPEGKNEWDLSLPIPTIIKTDGKGNIFILTSYSTGTVHTYLRKFKDNYTLEKLTILKKDA